MPFGLLPAALAVGSGGLVGIVLALIGGGGSILAVPLLVYVVGVPSTHVAIGTAAIAVALNAAFGLAMHARLGTVKWRCATVFAASGAAGAFLGSLLGKSVDGTQLLALFGLLMVVVGISMLRAPVRQRNEDVRLTISTAAQLLPRLVGIGGGVGILAGLFGIGGGFLIVPGLMIATGMSLKNSIGTSLVAVAAFGLTTAGSYAASGLIDWRLSSLMVAGGVAGSMIGARANAKLWQRKGVLNGTFATVVIAVGIYVVAKGAITLAA